MKRLLSLAPLLWANLQASPSITQLLTARTGTVQLPPGRFEISSEIRLPSGARNLTLLGNGTTFHATDGFHGRALLSCFRCSGIAIRNVSFDGNRSALEKRRPLPRAEDSFARFFPENGLLFEFAHGVDLDHLEFANMPTFAILVYRSQRISITHISVAHSGSRNAKGRNNTTGGVLLEEGTEDFVVADSSFEDIRGNAVWTHSRYRSPRNARGRIANNKFTEIGRDAIQVGHARDITVAGNTGSRIGYPVEEVDLEGMGTPVGIDTAGNVDRSVYESNAFAEINGKCIDLDGFHDGTVRGNSCVNRGKAEDYAYGNFGISLNNTSVEMRSRNILIEKNTLDGMKFGGIFVIGHGHRIRENKLLRLNMAHCNETHARFGCIAILDEPGFLESGIYLASRAERRDPARENTIENNTIRGWKMDRYCVRAAPGVLLTENRIEGNRCANE